MSLAKQAAQGGKISAITLTDNPGGTPAMSADFMGSEILKLGIEPLVHFTCKDKNRSQIESQLYALDRAGVRNLLVMSGDYPVSGYQGRPAPVFDLDPIHTLQLISDMNRGLTYPGVKGNVRHQPSDFFPGAVVSPFQGNRSGADGPVLQTEKENRWPAPNSSLRNWDTMPENFMKCCSL